MCVDENQPLYICIFQYAASQRICGFSLESPSSRLFIRQDSVWYTQTLKTLFSFASALTFHYLFIR